MNSHVKTIDNGTIWHVDVEELEVRVDALSKGLAAARESDEELEVRVDTLSKGLAAARESIYELKDDLNELQERRLDPADQEAGR